MTFPHHDAFWTAAADFVEARSRPGERVLAPDIFWYRLPAILRYRNTFLRPDDDYDWAILHKGELAALSRPPLERIARGRAVFANEVFVVWHNSDRHAAIDDGSPHRRAFFERLAECDGAAAPTAANDEPILPDPGSIARFELLSPEEVAAAMDALWKRGGYSYDTLRDRVHTAESDRYFAELIGDGAGRDLLDLCCGNGRLKGVADSARVVGVDISRVAVELARRRHADRPNFRFEQMRAEELSLPDASFDDVVMLEAVEHVHDLPRVFAETARVMRKGGRFLMTGANRDSVNQVLVRRLGQPGFPSTFQHIREYGYDEVVTLLGEAGFAVTKSAGIFLFPYWGVPGIDDRIRRATDDDPEFVELMRKLGERVGPEHAYTYLLLATKT